MKGIGIKLKPEFLQTLKELEKQFAPLILNTTIRSEFVDFLNKRYKDMRCQGTRYRGTVGIVGCAEVLWGTGPWLGYVVNMVINKVNARLN